MEHPDVSRQTPSACAKLDPSVGRTNMGLTGQGNFYLSVRVDSNGKPMLVLEPTGREKELLNGGYISLKLQEGTTFAEAQALADEMKKLITSTSIQTDS